MSRIAYVNGRYLPQREASVNIEDRGYQFADGVYEVIAVHGGSLVDEGRHLDRLDRSLAELRMAPPLSRRALRVVLREVLRRNGIARGIVYLQATRGVARREHAFPAEARTSLVVTARRLKPQPPEFGERGVAVVTMPDIRWKRCDIKTVGLLPNVLCKQRAKEAGAYEAWLVDERGLVTEGTASNAWIVTADGEIVTRQADEAILRGVTRTAVLDIASRLGLRLVERPFAVEEAKAAREAFVTGTTAEVLPVVRIDGSPVGEGVPGPVVAELRAAYCRFVAGGA